MSLAGTNFILSPFSSSRARRGERKGTLIQETKSPNKQRFLFLFFYFFSVPFFARQICQTKGGLHHLLPLCSEVRDANLFFKERGAPLKCWAAVSFEARLKSPIELQTCQVGDGGKLPPGTASSHKRHF